MQHPGLKVNRHVLHETKLCEVNARRWLFIFSLLETDDACKQL